MKFLYITLLFSYFTCTGQFLSNNGIESPNEANKKALTTNDSLEPKVLSIYPNPLKSETEITITNYASPVTLYVYDVYGRQVETIEKSSNIFILRREKMVAGVYNLALVTDHRTIRQKQILIVE